LIVLLAACDSGGPTATPAPSSTLQATPLPTRQPTATPLAVGAMLARYTFGPEDAPAFPAAEGAKTSPGRYEIGTDAVILSGTFDLAEVIAEAGLLIDTCANGGCFGLMVRAEDESHGYAFLLSCDDAFRVERRSGEDVEVLAEGDLTSSLRRSGAIPHLIKVLVRGDMLTFYLDNEVLAEIKDAAHDSGDVGFIVEGGAVIAFDHLVVWSSE
jgi:hypothetical protein